MPQIMQQLLEDINVHPFGTPHPRLAILGAVEAYASGASRWCAQVNSCRL